jgi:hypothetical protein
VPAINRLPRSLVLDRLNGCREGIGARSVRPDAGGIPADGDRRADRVICVWLRPRFKIETSARSSRTRAASTRRRLLIVVDSGLVEVEPSPHSALRVTVSELMALPLPLTAISKLMRRPSAPGLRQVISVASGPSCLVGQ